MNDSSLLDPLAEFQVGEPADMFDDPPLLHEPCGQVVCTVEVDDALDVLVRTAVAHRQRCREVQE